MKKEKACFACKMKKKVKLFPICLHMREFFCNFAAGFLCAYEYVWEYTYARSIRNSVINGMEENKQFDKKSLRYVMGKTADFGELAKDCVEFAELEKMVRAMARNAEIRPIGGRKYRRYSAK